MCSHGQVLSLVGACFLVHNHLFTVTSQGRRGKLIIWGLFYKGPNPSLGEGNGNPLLNSCLVNPMDRSHVTQQAPLSMGFSRQEYWSGCHCLLRVLVLGDRNFGEVIRLGCVHA